MGNQVKTEALIFADSFSFNILLNIRNNYRRVFKFDYDYLSNATPRCPDADQLSHNAYPLQ